MCARIAILVSATLIIVSFVGCGRGRTSIAMAGSTAFQPFAEKLADQYMAKHTNVTITVQGGGIFCWCQAMWRADSHLRDKEKMPSWKQYPLP